MKRKNRIIRKTIRFTQEEYNALEKSVAASKMKNSKGEDNFSAYMRECILSKTGYRNLRMELELRELRYEIRKIGVNINQIAKQLNAGYGFPDDADAIQDLLKQVEDTVLQYEKKVVELWQSHG